MNDDQASTAASIDATFTLSVNENEREVVLLALQELLNSVRRDEHLTPVLQTLIARVQRAAPSA